MAGTGGEDKGPAVAGHSRLARALFDAAATLPLSGKRVVVAASAGLDSTVLAHLLAECQRELRIEVCLGHVHHGLRASEADDDQRFVAALAAELKAPFAHRRVDTRSAQHSDSSRDRRTLQETARELRRDALYEIAIELDCDVIATAHHADDQAETLLMRLLRGTGPDGLAGILPCSPDGRLIRPLLCVSREEIEAHAEARGIVWREDSSNASDRYQRNRIRRHWLPALTEEFNPKLLRALGDLAEAQQRDAEWINDLVAQEARARLSKKGAWLRIDTRDWERLPEALTRRLVRSALVRCGAGRHVSRRHLERMLAFLREGRLGTAIELPNSLQLRRDAEGFLLGPGDSRPQGAC